MIPYDLLSLAMTVIPPEKVRLYKAGGMAVDEYGIERPEYAEAEEIKASVQAVDNQMYQTFGLDLQKNYKLVYASVKLAGINSQEVPDRIEYDGKLYEVVRETDWSTYNGWSGVLVVEVKANENGK